MSAILFNLWNPYRADDGTLTFEITQADTFRIHRCSQEFLDAALREFGLVVDAYSWQITPGRALYYSDYPDEADWHNRWPLTWRIHITPETPLPPRSNALFRAPAVQGLSDNTQPEPDDNEEDRYRNTAFVIVDFCKPRDEVEHLARTMLANATLRATLLEPAIREVGDGVRQLQTLVRDLDLPADVAALETLVAGFKAAGGAVNWRSRLTWPTEPSEEVKADIAAWLSSFHRLREKE